MKRVLMPLAPGFEEVEALTVVDILRRAGAEVVMAGTVAGTITGRNGIRVEPDALLDDSTAEDYDLVVLPGGAEGTENLKRDKRVLELVRDYNARNKDIGAICAAPTVLAEAGILDGRRVTSHPGARDKLGRAVVSDDRVVVDGNIVTSQGPGTAAEFGLMLTEMLYGAAKAFEVNKGFLAIPHTTQNREPEAGMGEERRQIADWEEEYSTKDVKTLPWYHTDMDADLAVALRALGITEGRALDLGTGPGTQAIALAKYGFDVTATDIAPSAIKKAREAAAAEGVEVEFMVDDILDSRIEGEFDLVFDRGCFHTLHPEHRAAYVREITGHIKSGGYLLLKVMSHLEQLLTGGPYRFTPGDITEYFGADFETHSIEETVFHGTLENDPLALFAILKRP